MFLYEDLALTKKRTSFVGTDNVSDEASAFAEKNGLYPFKLANGEHAYFNPDYILVDKC